MRSLFGVVAALASVLLGPFALVLVAVGPREPWLLLVGLSGIFGLVGGAARVWFGPRFFALRRWARLFIVLAIAAGIGATGLAALGLPGNVYLATLAPLVGTAGLVLLAGSVAGSGPGPNNSFKPAPLRGAA